MTFTLKRLQPGDEAILAHVDADVFDEPVEAARLAAYLRAPGHLLVLALDAGLVVGQCAAVVHHHPDKATELYVDEVGTATTHLRRGIARAMMAEMFAWGRELGCAEAWLGTELDNVAANGLYRAIAGRPDKMMYYEFKLEAD